MLLPVVAFLLIVLIASWRIKGPLWALCIAWLIGLAPIATGAVRYRYLVDADYRYSAALIVFLAAFVLGAVFYEGVRRPVRAGSVVVPDADTFRLAFRRVLPAAQICWCVAMLATALNFIDYSLLGGAGLDDLAALRDTYSNRRATSTFAQLASILTWACLFCYIFALFFRRELGTRRCIFFLIPIAGYFSLSVFSAGRQAAFQIMVVSLLLVIVTRIVRGRGPPRRHRRLFSPEGLGLAAITAAMVGYMGYVAVARNDGNISDDKSVVLMTVFDFTFSPAVDRIVQAMSSGLRGAIVEAVVYFSASLALFEPFLTITWRKLYYGALTFPVFFRQIEAFTGLSPSVGLIAKMDAITATGVLGSGWATAMSAYLIDFGYTGTLIFLFVMGAYSAFAWRKALAFSSFYYLVIGILILMNAIYMPLVPSVSDTNLAFLWLFCLFMHHQPYLLVLPTRRSVPPASIRSGT